MNQRAPKERILLAALDEFGQKGYVLASTNQIAKNANTSKGAIFQHFQNKALLFFAVYDYAMNLFLQAYETYEFPHDSDIIQQISHLVVWKAAFMNRHPMLKNVLWEGLTNPPLQLKQKMEQSFQSLRAISVESLITKIDFQSLNPKLSQATIMRNMTIATAGLQAVYLNQQLTEETLQQAQIESMKFIATVMKGMKASHE